MRRYNDKLIPELRKKINENDYQTTIHRANEYSYVVSFDKLQQEMNVHPGKSTLIDIHSELHHNRENLLNNQGFIHINEYIIDGYKCRCHEQNNKDIDNKHLFNYKIEL